MKLDPRISSTENSLRKVLDKVDSLGTVINSEKKKSSLIESEIDALKNQLAKSTKSFTEFKDDSLKAFKFALDG